MVLYDSTPLYYFYYFPVPVLHKKLTTYFAVLELAHLLLLQDLVVDSFLPGSHTIPDEHLAFGYLANKNFSEDKVFTI